MQVDYPYIPLVRINAPEIFADPEFKQWFFNRPKGCESAKYAPVIATWHQPQEADFGEYSDFFTTVDGGGGSATDKRTLIPATTWPAIAAGSSRCAMMRSIDSASV